jgi:hypothetical protein
VNELALPAILDFDYNMGKFVLSGSTVRFKWWNGLR